MDKQKTIKAKLYFEGNGLHGGKPAKIEILPAPPNNGIVFVRQDDTCVIIKADFYSVLDAEKFPRRTSVGANGVYVHTIEHLMAAFHILGINNIQVNIWGEEIPGLDGSSKLFVEKMIETGIEEQDAPVNCLVIKEPLWVEEGSSSIVVMPSDRLRVSYAL